MVILNILAVEAFARGEVPVQNLSPQNRVLVAGLFVTCSASITLFITSMMEERERTFTQLIEREAEYKSLLEATPALVGRFDAEGKITYVNSKIVELIGLPSSQIIGRNYKEFLPARYRESSTQSLLQTTNPPTAFEIEHPSRSGENRYVRWVTQAVRKADNTIMEFHVFGVDLTMQKRIDDERRNFESHIVQTQKLESMGLMAGGIAHDFNNLLTVVTGYTDLATEALPPDSEPRNYLERIREATVRAADLARQMLAYAGKAKHSFRDTNLHDLISETSRLLSSSIPKKVELHFSPCPEPLIVFGDATQLRQIVMNLVINAGEAIGDKPGRITLRTKLVTHSLTEFGGSSFDPTLPPGSYARLDVTDTGSGMDTATVNKIFDPFFTTKFTGRGLGLAAVLGIIRSHGGSITVDSEPGKGTRFRILLPLSSALNRTATISSQQTVNTLTPPPGTALVVDDEESIRDMTKAFLETMGWKAITAENGKEAVKIFRKHADQIDLVLLDMTMPEMDGPETLFEIRKIRASVKVIFCSGYSSEALKSMSHSTTPPPLFLAKPYRMEDLRNAVSSVR